MKFFIGKNKKNDTQRAAFNVCNEENESAHVEMTELCERRTLKSKTYSDGCGNMKSEYYCMPVHFIDNGVYKETDNRFADTGNSECEIKSNSFRAVFRKYSKEGNIFTVQKEGCNLELISEDCKENGMCKLVNLHDKTGALQSSTQLLNGLKPFANMRFNVDVEGIKSNIVINEKWDKYEFKFKLCINNLIPGVSGDGKDLILKHGKTNEPLISIPSTVMRDCAGNTSDSIYYEIEQEADGALVIKVIADEQWINSDECVLPAEFALDFKVKADEEITEKSVICCKNSVGGSDSGNKLVIVNAKDAVKASGTFVILKNNLPDNVLQSLRKAEITFSVENGNPLNDFYVNGECFVAQKGSKYCVDVTVLLSDDKTEITIPVECFGSVSDSRTELYLTKLSLWYGEN